MRIVHQEKVLLASSNYPLLLLGLSTLFLHALATRELAGDLLDLAVAVGGGVAVGARGLHGVDALLLVRGAALLPRLVTGDTADDALLDFVSLNL